MAIAQRSWILQAAVALAVPIGAHGGQGSEWSVAGGDRQNTRSQPSENTLSVANANRLAVKWSLETAGDVSATPSVDATSVYVPDWAGYLYAVDRATGLVRWRVYLPDVTGVPYDKARATPALTFDKVIIGTQGSILVPGGAPGAKLLAFDKASGALRWSMQLDTHPAAIVTQSATPFDGRVFVGVASQEEALAAFIHPYQLSFRGSFLALNVDTGQILWKTTMVPTGYTGGAVWGSSPAIDVKRGAVYVATGNNYSVPPQVLECVAAAGSPAAQSACLAPDDYFDSILALDMKTGAIRWATRAVPYDAWTVDCIPFFGTGENCPTPAGPDYDFGQAPQLFKATGADGRQIEMLGAGQKSGKYWALDPVTGAVRWVTAAGPGGTTGGLQWGSAVDGRRVYTANSNSNGIPWTPLGSASATIKGAWSGLDAATGAVLWQTVDPNFPAGFGGGPSGPPTTANGVVFACSLDPVGTMYALNGATGAILWSYASGGSCLSGAAIADGTLYWGSGYSNFGFGTPNHRLFAFSLAP